jgi:hypothetical protein
MRAGRPSRQLATRRVGRPGRPLDPSGPGRRGTPPRAHRASESHPGADEENAEELIELLLSAARAGEWRVVGMMWDRVFGRPKETVEHQTGKSAADEALDRMSDEELEAQVQAWRLEAEH